MNMNMNWQSDDFTVYALNEQGVNDFSFHIQGNGRKGHDPKTLQKVVAMAEAAPDIYNAAKGLIDYVVEKYGLENESELSCPHMIELSKALAKARGE